MNTLKELYNIITQTSQLPGKVAHAELSPLPMSSRYLHYSKDVNYRIGAVLVLLYLKDQQPYFVVTQRHDYDEAHAGQISLPGGSYEEEDQNTAQTARRETSEEIGVISSEIEIISPLTELYIPPSNFLVYPYVGAVEGEIVFEKDDFEVKEVIEISVKDLLKNKITYKPFSQLTSKVKYKQECPCFEFDDKVIWGATAMILNELKHILLQ